MSISAASIPVGATISPTGGSATSFTVLGGDESRVEAVLADGSAFAARTKMTFTAKSPKTSASAPGGYTQLRNKVVISKPKTLANGNTTLNTISVELSVDPESSAADMTALQTLACLLLSDSDFTAFWQQQSLI